MELFEAAQNRIAKHTGLIPLAERMRPERLDDFVGQEHLLGPGRFLRILIEKDQLQSLILWGPPGTGKTTLASIIAGLDPVSFSYLFSGPLGRKGDPPGHPGSGGAKAPGTQDRSLCG